MSRELVTRAELKGLDMAARWMIASGQPDGYTGAAKGVRGGIQLYVTDDSGRTVAEVPLDVHDAGDLYAALEEHMENITEAPPITQEERERLLRKDWRKSNLRAVKDEIDRPLQARTITPELARALEVLLYEWGERFTDHTAKDPGWIRDRIRHDYPHLGEALDALANLNP